MSLDITNPARYNVINTFDRWKYQWQPGMDIEGYGRSMALPNVPMRADRTLLADMLRNGRFCNQGRKFSRANVVIPFNVANHRDVISKVKKNQFGKLIGVEIEYYPTNQKLRNFSSPLEDITSDGSLNCGGREIRRLTWIGPNGRLRGILSMNLKGKVDKTCGLHVHVDARHLGSEGFLGSVETYERVIQFYPFLKKLVPKSRLDNQYCRWVNNCFNSDGCQNSSSRYAAINYHSYSEHCTFEFRCQGGSVNPEKIEAWALLCSFLVNYAAREKNNIPKTWLSFINMLPMNLKTWCIQRKEKLYGSGADTSEVEIAA